MGQLHTCSSRDPVSETHYLPDRTPNAIFCPCLVRLHLEKLHPASPKSLAGWCFPWICTGCSKGLVFETTTSSKVPEGFIESLLSFHGRDFSQSEKLNLVQSWTTQYRRCSLRKYCCFTVDWKCTKWEWNLIFDCLFHPMESRNNYALNDLIFAFCGTSSVVAQCDYRRICFSKEEIVLRFRYHVSCFWHSNKCYDCRTTFVVGF